MAAAKVQRLVPSSDRADRYEKLQKHPQKASLLPKKLTYENMKFIQQTAGGGVVCSSFAEVVALNATLEGDDAASLFKLRDSFSADDPKFFGFPQVEKDLSTIKNANDKALAIAQMFSPFGDICTGLPTEEPCQVSVKQACRFYFEFDGSGLVLIMPSPGDMTGTARFDQATLTLSPDLMEYTKNARYTKAIKVLMEHGPEFGAVYVYKGIYSVDFPVITAYETLKEGEKKPSAVGSEVFGEVKTIDGTSGGAPAAPKGKKKPGKKSKPEQKPKPDASPAAPEGKKSKPEQKPKPDASPANPEGNVVVFYISSDAKLKAKRTIAETYGVEYNDLKDPFETDLRETTFTTLYASFKTKSILARDTETLKTNAKFLGDLKYTVTIIPLEDTASLDSTVDELTIIFEAHGVRIA